MYDRPCLQNLAEKNVSIQVYYPCTKVDPLTKVGKMTVKEIRKILQAGKKKKNKDDNDTKPHLRCYGGTW